ncbi:hypothetical protein RI367_004745 [Sorochytrium milnesiophthora]
MADRVPPRINTLRSQSTPAVTGGGDEQLTISTTGRVSGSTTPRSASIHSAFSLSPTRQSTVQLVPNTCEKLLFCIDLHEENNAPMRTSSEPGAQEAYDTGCISRLQWAKQLIKRFIKMKLLQRSEHQFGLVTLDTEARLFVAPTSDVEFLFAALDGIETQGPFMTFDMSSLVKLVKPMCDTAGPAVSFLVRTIFLYSRSTVFIDFADERVKEVFLCFLPTSMTTSWVDLIHAQDLLDWYLAERFFLDTVYMHNRVGEDNFAQDIYDAMAQFDSSSGNTYRFEVSMSAKRFATFFTLLLAHPLQRSQQILAASAGG